MQLTTKVTLLSIAIASFAFVSSASPSEEWQARVSKDLLATYKAKVGARVQAEASNPKATLPVIRGQARFDAKDRIQVHVKLDCTATVSATTLEHAGLAIGTTVRVPPLCAVEGWLAPAALPALAVVEGVTRIELPHYSARKNPMPAGASSSLLRQNSVSRPQGISPSAIDAAGINLMRADQFIAQTGATGTGITVGVMSDDATNVAIIQARGELPGNITLIPAGTNPTPTDEGTMMLEEVHAVAPGAGLVFCGPQSSAEYVSCLQQLISAGATVVVDDIAYPTEDLMSSNGQFAQAVQSVLASNPTVSLFTVTGNYNQSYWEGTYQPITANWFAPWFGVFNLPYGWPSCPSSGQIDYYTNAVNGQTIPGSTSEGLTVLAAGTYQVKLQWADPYEQNASDFDLYIVDEVTGEGICGGSTAPGNTDTYIAGAVPFTVSPDAGSYGVFIADAGPVNGKLMNGKFMKLWVGGDGATSLTTYTSGSIVSPQAFVPGVNLIGAVLGSDGVGNTIEPYSGLGPINLTFPVASQIAAPSVVAPDGVIVDAAGTDFESQLWADGTFHGTSAASPNVAAVAALLASAFPSLTPAQLTAALQGGATPLGTANTFGYGRVDALGALAQIPSPLIGGFNNAAIIGGTSSSPLPIAVSGTGKLTVSVSPAALVPASGVHLAPSNCGNGVNACTVVFTPTIGQSGSTTAVLTVTDGANRSASYQAAITVVKPPTPTVKVTSGASQAITVGAALKPVSFSLTGTAPLTVTFADSGLTSATMSPGCGTTSMSCTATLGSVPTAGTASLTLSVQDSYAQTASATASVTATAVLAPAATSAGGGGGGGELGLMPLLGLGALTALLRRRDVKAHY